MTDLKPTEREIVATDHIKAKGGPQPGATMTDMEETKLLTLEFLNETTGERRTVEIPDPVTYRDAYQKGAELRQAGEILLQVMGRE